MSCHNLDENQRMLADSVRKYIDRGYGEKIRQESMSHPDGCSPERWTEFARLGWLALALPEDDGGLGGSISDVCVVAEELGRGLVNEPYVASTILGALLLSDAAEAGVRKRWLPGLADGSRRIAFAPWESSAGFDLAVIATTAKSTDAGFSLCGEKSLVLGGTGADAYLISARLDHSDLLGLYLVEAGVAGLTMTPTILFDGQPAARLRLDGVQVLSPLLVKPEAQMLALLRNSVDRAIVVFCAETVGVMARTFEITLEYLKARKQFGRPISENQVVQHRLVDLYVEIEEARALTRAAAKALNDECTEDNLLQSRFVAAAKACVTLVSKHVWEESVQLHGAIGMTDEYVVGAFVKRLAVAGTLYGGLELQLERLADASLGRSKAENILCERCP